LDQTLAIRVLTRQQAYGVDGSYTHADGICGRPSPIFLGSLEKSASFRGNARTSRLDNFCGRHPFKALGYFSLQRAYDENCE
jgi:hypothetical protein